VGRDEAAISATSGAGVDRIIVLDGAGLIPPVAETDATALADACRRHEVGLIILPATTRWREVAPHLAARLGAACVTDVLELRRTDDGTLQADRLLYGGVAVATIGIQRHTAVCTLSLAATGGASASPSSARTPSVTVEEARVARPAKELLDRTPLEPTVDLASARRVVAVGRGLRTQDDLALVEALVAALDAELGCSRPLAEDVRWLPPERQVGLTGCTVKPDLYMAVGISGQIQHLVGMRDSRVIVAVNTNPAAPIFEVADIGVVGDLYEVVPRLTVALAAHRSKAG
jgi:electron transfer flavoprotein alpha subunit